VSYLSLTDFFLGVVITETEKIFFEKKVSKFQIQNFKIKKKIEFEIKIEIKFEIEKKYICIYLFIKKSLIFNFLLPILDDAV
jgi:hypothetical protein